MTRTSKPWTWHAPQSVLFNGDEARLVGPERNRFMVAKTYPIDLQMVCQPVEQTSVDVVTYAMAVYLSRNERRRAARAGRRFPRRVPAALQWTVRIGRVERKADGHDARKAIAMFRPLYAELMR